MEYRQTASFFHAGMRTWGFILVVSFAVYPPGCHRPHSSRPEAQAVAPPETISAGTSAPAASPSGQVESASHVAEARLDVFEGLTCGPEPAVEADFVYLAAQGVRTIISVDGAIPNVEAASRFGMRYVHLPIGYDGVSSDQALQIARAIQSLPRPIYLHCHHGKHRAPAAAAVAAIEMGRMTPEEGTALLKKAGTSPNYAGLYRDVAAAAPVAPKTLAAADLASFPSVTESTHFIARMSDIDRRWDELKLIKEAGWTPPPTQPDLSRVHIATIIAEGFREAIRAEAEEDRPRDYRELMRSAEAAAWSLAAPGETSKARLDAHYQALRDSCTTCHKQYRD